MVISALLQGGNLPLSPRCKNLASVPSGMEIMSCREVGGSAGPGFLVTGELRAFCV